MTQTRLEHEPHTHNTPAADVRTLRAALTENHIDRNTVKHALARITARLENLHTHADRFADVRLSEHAEQLGSSA